ncbi:hypothetical protein QFZ71_005224 [Streptomyces sp. V2I9]|nr:hypothetical protein [Streptomyces sp. V2I9]
MVFSRARLLRFAMGLATTMSRCPDIRASVR